MTPQSIAFAKEQIARGMSEEAVRLALGIRQRDWFAVRQQIVGAATAKEVDAGGVAEQPATVNEMTERPSPPPAVKPPALSVKQASMVQKVAKPLPPEPPDVPQVEIRDTVKALALALRTIVLEEAGITLRELHEPGKRGVRTKATAPRGYVCWLLRTHVAGITANEIAALVNRPVAAVHSNFHVIESMLDTPVFAPEIADLHCRVRVRIETEHRCERCRALASALAHGERGAS